MAEIDLLLTRMIRMGGSDLHMTTGNKPYVRESGDLQAIKDEPIYSIELMKLISTEAKAVGSNLVGVSGSDGVPTADQPDFIPITVTVSLNGTFNQMMMFLSNLTKTSKVILTKSISMTASAAPGAATPIVTFSATFESYRFKAEGTGGT